MVLPAWEKNEADLKKNTRKLRQLKRILIIKYSCKGVS